MKYNIFKDRGPFTGCIIPRGYQLLRIHTIFDVKVDGQHKACVVADEHLTATPVESVYLGVVPLRGEKRSAQPLPEARVCGNLNTIKEDIDM